MHFSRRNRWESASWITSTTGSFWPSQRTSFYLTDPCLSHLKCLGLRVNFAKSARSPSQRILFLGKVIDSTQMRAVVMPERALAIQQLATSFKLRVPHPLKAFQRMLGLMASVSLVLQLGLLHIWPLQYMLKPWVPQHAWHHGCLPVKVNQGGVAALVSWKNHQHGTMERGVPLGMVYRRKIVSTDATILGWGALCDGKRIFGL